MIVKDWSRPSLMRRPASRANALDLWMKANGAELHLQVTKYHRRLQVCTAKEPTGNWSLCFQLWFHEKIAKKIWTKKFVKIRWFCTVQLWATLISRNKITDRIYFWNKRKPEVIWLLSLKNSTQTSSSPLSQRASRSSFTSSSRSSTSTKPTSPGQASTTVITVDSGSRRMSKDSIKESPQEEALPSPPPATNTHIIKVSGPVTNLDETVTSAEQSETMSEVVEPPSPPPTPDHSPSKVVQTSV